MTTTTEQRAHRAGRLWAEREASVVSDWKSVARAWRSTSNDARSLIETEGLDEETLEDLANVCNDAASERWAELYDQAQALPEFPLEAQSNIEETGVDVLADITRLRNGHISPYDLLQECLDGADEDRRNGWRVYVRTLRDFVDN